MNFVELTRQLEKFDNRFEVCLKAARLARKARADLLHDEARRSPIVEVLETMVAGRDEESGATDEQSPTES